jgi:hypothetical protein
MLPALSAAVLQAARLPELPLLQRGLLRSAGVCRAVLHYPRPALPAPPRLLHGLLLQSVGLERAVCLLASSSSRRPRINSNPGPDSTNGRDQPDSAR